MSFVRNTLSHPAVRGTLRSPLLWGLVATVGFYIALFRTPLGTQFLLRYTARDPVEFVETAMFFIGLSIIAIKALRLRREYRAFDTQPLLGPHQTQLDHIQAVGVLCEDVALMRPKFRNTYWGRRLENLAAFLKGTKTSEGVADHLDHLAAAEQDHLQSSHALLQTVIWSIPILGFLGTVMGITLAIANLTMEQLDKDITAVTGGLGVAFDTTALALAYSLVLGFTSLFVKRSEEQLLFDIDEHSRLEIHRCFPSSAATGLGLDAAQQAAATTLIDKTRELVTHQTSLWHEAVNTMREDWRRTIDGQREELTASLASGTSSALREHHELLSETRENWRTLQAGLGEKLLGDMDESLRQRSEREAEFLAALGGIAERMDRAAADQSRRHAHETTQLLDGLREQMQAWQSQMSEFTTALTSQASALTRAGEQLEQIALRKQELADLQRQLTHNLEAIRAAEAFDETLHNLSAAVHLLTSRVRSRDVA